MKHSLCGPSSLQRRKLCAGSLRMEQGLPDNPSDDSRRGDDLHGYTGTLLRCLGDEIPAQLEADLQSLDPYDRQVIDTCVETVAAEHAARPGWQLLTDHTMNLEFILGPGEVGTLDVGLVEPFGQGIVWDFKMGFMDVPPADENEQLAAYALGLMRMYDLESCEVRVVLPCLHKETRHVYHASDVPATSGRLKAIVAAAHEKDAPLSPGASQCRFCKAAGTCPELAKRTADLALTKTVEGLSLADLGKHLDACEIAHTHIKAVKTRAFALLTAGATIPGWCLGQGKRTREWIPDVLTALTEAGSRLGKKTDDLIEIKVASPSGVEKVWGTSKKVQVELAKLIVWKPGKQRLEKTDGHAITGPEDGE